VYSNRIAIFYTVSFLHLRECPCNLNQVSCYTASDWLSYRFIQPWIWCIGSRVPATRRHCWRDTRGGQSSCDNVPARRHACLHYRTHYTHANRSQCGWRLLS